MDYCLAMDGIQATESQQQVDLFCLPHAKKEHRNKILKGLKNRVTRTVKSSSTGVKSMEDVYNQLASKLNG